MVPDVFLLIRSQLFPCIVVPFIGIQGNRDGQSHPLSLGVIRHPTKIPAELETRLGRFHIRSIVHIQPHLEALGNEPAILDNRVRLLISIIQRRLDDKTVRHQLRDGHRERIRFRRNRVQVREETIQPGIPIFHDRFRHIPRNFEFFQGIQFVRKLLTSDECGPWRRIIRAKGLPGRFPFQFGLRMEILDPEQAGMQDFIGGKPPGHLSHGHRIRIDADKQAFGILGVPEFPVADKAVVLVQAGRGNPVVLVEIAPVSLGAGVLLSKVESLEIIVGIQYLQEPFPLLMITEDGAGSELPPDLDPARRSDVPLRGGHPEAPEDHLLRKERIMMIPSHLGLHLVVEGLLPSLAIMDPCAQIAVPVLDILVEISGQTLEFSIVGALDDRLDVRLALFRHMVDGQIVIQLPGNADFEKLHHPVELGQLPLRDMREAVYDGFLGIFRQQLLQDRQA